MEGPSQLLTIGHSNHSAERFGELLSGAGVELVADVRRYPGSRRNPQFGQPALERFLARSEIGYEPLGEELGGRRRPLDDSRNAGWRNAQFRGYADHMRSAEFERGIERLEQLAARRRVVVMCAEAYQLHCHRQLIADAWVARGGRVVHVQSSGGGVEHRLTPFAVVADGEVSYPPEGADQERLEL